MGVYVVYGVWYMGYIIYRGGYRVVWIERWTKALVLMLGMMVIRSLFVMIKVCMEVCMEVRVFAMKKV